MASKPKDGPFLNDPEAIRRRKALKSIMIERDLTTKDLERLANVQANSLYNFFGGRSKSLSTSTLERLAAAIPGVTVGALQGSTSQALKIGDGIDVVAEAQAGVWRERFDLPLDQRERVPLPATDAERLAGAYAVRVVYPGCENMFENGTLLICIPSPRWEPALHPGNRVLVQMARDGRIEVTVREIVAGSDGALWVQGRSTDPSLNAPLKVPEGNRGRPWAVPEGRISIVAVVAAYFARTPTIVISNPPAADPPRRRASDKVPETKNPHQRKAGGVEVKRNRA